ncbi:hypothetical protein [Marinifilum caeruleilacunae]|uniref:DUF3108 domain-containing protein n=1 Tax=Marinifilum caeruleilacunae TaxID=2499076 RepID=A0ABX1X0R8_9BACT|nr:hypothetical protein [Marinifilum caeruleilacunae]NOU62010.1 hypothetical protein [Marinifilum caeruleilacunae]
MKETKLTFLFLFIVLLTSGQVKKKSTLMTNGLDNRLSGEWINTTLVDSTVVKKQLNPYIFQFYGDLRLSISTSDHVNLYGNMDGAESLLERIDSKTFSIPDRFDNPKFEYQEERDLIIQNPESKFPIIYRRIKKSDPLHIIQSEEKFSKYFIHLFFKDFKLDENEEITDLWIGFDTYFPFDFDAIGIKKKSGEVQYYAWKIENHTLYLYETKTSYDEESGFSNYHMGKLSRTIKKRMANNAKADRLRF